METSNNSLSTIDQRTRHKISKDKEELDEIANEKNLDYIYRTFHPTTAEYTFFPNDDINQEKPLSWAIKQISTNLKELKIIQFILSDYNGNNYKLITEGNKKSSKYLRTKCLNNLWIKGEVSREIFLKIHWTEWKWNYNVSKYVGHSWHSFEGKFYLVV